MNMEYKYDVFISYSRKDYVDEKGNVLPDSPVKKIREAFDGHGITYWFDEEGIYSSEEFMRKIVQAIAKSKMLVFISSKASNASHWTAGEILEAIDGKKMILPVKIDSCRYNDCFKLPLLPLEFIDYQRNPENALDRLLYSVMAKVEKGKYKPGKDLLSRTRRSFLFGRRSEWLWPLHVLWLYSLGYCGI